MMSGVGVMAVAVLALFGGFIGCFPAFKGQLSTPATVIVLFVFLPISAWLWFIAVRRMRWEYRHGGILRNSLSGGGVVFAVFVIAVGLMLIFSTPGA